MYMFDVEYVSYSGAHMNQTKNWKYFFTYMNADIWINNTTLKSPTKMLL